MMSVAGDFHFKKIGQHFSYAGKSLVNLFFPHVCAGCRTDLADDEQLLCLGCMQLLPVTNFHMHANNPVEKIFWGRLPLASATSLLYFTKDSVLQHLMHQFKYKGRKEIGWYLGRLMGIAFQSSNRFLSIDGIIPLPLHQKKERLRGYNQAAILAEGISQVMHVPVISNAVIRVEATETQTKKNRTDRWKNIGGKFKILNADVLKSKHMLLIDDVVTTGATLESCGKTLLNEPSLRLSIATLAYTSL